jgi:hypothetical protein
MLEALILGADSTSLRRLCAKVGGALWSAGASCRTPERLRELLMVAGMDRVTGMLGPVRSGELANSEARWPEGA